VEGVAARRKVGGSVPVPVSVTVWGEPVALSVAVSVAAKVPAAVGVNITDNVQDVPAASDVPQVLVWAKSCGLAPAMAIDEMLRTPVPALSICTVWAAVVMPVIDVKVRADGANVTTGTGISVKAAVMVLGALMMMVVAAVVVLATAPVQLVKEYPAAGVAVRFTTVPAG